MGEVTVEERGRITIPKFIRNKLDIRGGEKLKIENRDGEIVLRPSDSGESLKDLKGCIDESEVDSMEVNEIWRQ